MSQGWALCSRWSSILGSATFILPALSFAAAPEGASLSGELSATPSGAAVYQLPLLTPPGAIKPSLSIAYSSQSGNGPLGMGWSLSGLSQIGRCPRIKTIDGVDDGIVQFNANDRLCLDGQRLILKSGSAYGASGAEYRAQIDSDTKVLGHGDFANGTAWFQVWTKSGQILEFGNTADSRQQFTPPGTSTALTYTWALSKASDRFSNFYTVTYLKDSGALYPQTVSYAGNANAGAAPSRTLSFDWTPATARPDPIPAYLGAGVSGTVRYRLAGISNNANPARYKLTYSLSGAGLSNLTRINYCPDGTDNNCLKVESQYGHDKDPATGKRMSDPQLVLAAFGKNQGWTDQNVHPRQLGDVNGDGRLDIVGFASDGVYVSFGTATGFTTPVKKLNAFGVSAGGWSNNSTYPRMVTDINGDGLADIVGFSSSAVFVSTSTGEGFTEPAQWVAGYGTANGWATQDAYPRTLADVDGDGLLDVVGFSSSHVMVALNKRTKFEESPAFSTMTGFTKNAGWTSNDAYPRMVIDINGDGRADVTGFSSSGVYVSLSLVGGFAAPVLWNSESWARVSTTRKISNGEGGMIPCGFFGTWGAGAERIFADINGDGLADIVGFDVQDTRIPYVFTSHGRGNTRHRCIDDSRTTISATSAIYVSFNSGSGFSPRKVIGSEFSGINTSVDAAYNYLARISRQVADVNIDDRGDIVSFNGACARMKASNSTGLDSDTCLTSGFTPENGGWTPEQNRVITDINGDGVTDILGFGSAGVYVSYGTAKNPNQLLSLKSDLADSAITYSTLVDPDVYSKGAGSAFPVVDVQYPMSVVKSISNPDGLGGTNLSRYRYGGLRSHFDYGSLGFQWMVSMDDASGALSYSEYLQGFPLTGSLSRSQEQRCSNRAQLPWTGCEALSQEVSEWEVNESGSSAASKLYRPYIQKTREHSWLKSSSAP